jgi:hypothetical protein
MIHWNLNVLGEVGSQSADTIKLNFILESAADEGESICTENRSPGERRNHASENFHPIQTNVRQCCRPERTNRHSRLFFSRQFRKHAVAGDFMREIAAVSEQDDAGFVCRHETDIG